MTPHDAPSPDRAADPHGSDAHDARGARRTKKPMPLWQETLLLLVVALALAILIKTFFVQAFYIPSPSMEPEFIENDRILVEKPSYWFGGEPQRGDIVVFQDPGSWLPQADKSEPGNVLARAFERIGLYPSGGHLVKRVIGVGGDRVVCCDDRGRVTVNGKALDESSYLPRGTKPSLTTFDVRVPSGRLWMMGDNRGDSADSRSHMGDPGGGAIDETLVVGKVFALVWPLDRAELVRRPASFEGIPTGRP